MFSPNSFWSGKVSLIPHYYFFKKSGSRAKTRLFSFFFSRLWWKKMEKLFLTQTQMILTSKQHAEYSFASLNTQHLSTTVENAHSFSKLKTFSCKKKKNWNSQFYFVWDGRKRIWICKCSSLDQSGLKVNWFKIKIKNVDRNRQTDRHKTWTNIA